MTPIALRRARIGVAREAGHDANCALAFAARLRAQADAVRDRLAISPCLCRARRARWSPAVRWFVCRRCGRDYVASRQARRSQWCSDACKTAAYRANRRPA